MRIKNRLEYERNASVEDINVYDQKCSGCRYYWRDHKGISDDVKQKRPTCHNPDSEYFRKNSPTNWCWAWSKTGSGSGFYDQYNCPEYKEYYGYRYSNRNTINNSRKGAAHA